MQYSKLQGKNDPQGQRNGQNFIEMMEKTIYIIGILGTKHLISKHRIVNETMVTNNGKHVSNLKKHVRMY